MRIMDHIKSWNRWRKLDLVGVSKKDKFLTLFGIKKHSSLTFIKMLDRFENWRRCV